MTSTLDFPDSSVGKESTCNAGDPDSIPGLGRSAGEGIDYPLQYSSLVAQLVKNLPAMRETWVGSLGWEDPLEKGKATHSNILAWRIPWGHKELDTTERLSDIQDYRVDGILQAKILECVAFPFSRGSSSPRDRTWVSGIADRFFTI